MYMHVSIRCWLLVCVLQRAAACSSSGRSFKANIVWRSQFQVVSIFHPGLEDIRAPVCRVLSSSLGVVMYLMHSMTKN